jgi:small neutral amino acid transporter SnatA (MarC family)
MRETIFKYFGSLLMEEKKNKTAISLGRFSFLVIFALALYIWAPFGKESLSIPEDMMQLLMVLAGYNFGSKGIELLKTHLESKKVGKQEETEEVTEKE